MTTEAKRIRPTLQDIADKVGITKMTVSRFMRNPNSVAEATRQKIAVVVEEIGYIQNRTPAMLSKSSSKAIGILLPSLSNQVFARFTQGIESVTTPMGYDTLITHYGYDTQLEEQKVESLLSYQVDGLILTDTKHSPRTVQMLRTAAIPVVEAMDIPTAAIDMAVGLDHMEAANQIVQKMIRTGKTNIAYLGAQMDTRTQLRMQGYDKAITEAGLEPLHILTKERSSFALGSILLSKALLMQPTLDGVFCTNDDIAIGTVRACRSRQLRVPQDIAVAGFNALDIGQVVTPSIASIRTPRFDIGKKSAELLLQILSGQKVEQKIHDLGFTITEGSSL